MLQKISFRKNKSRKNTVFGYAFQIEMKFTAWKYGFNVVEVPVIFTDRQEGASKMSGGIFFEAFFGVMQMKIKSYFKNWD